MIYREQPHVGFLKDAMLPFWVLTGAPEDLVPATDKGAASVDIFLKSLTQKST